MNKGILYTIIASVVGTGAVVSSVEPEEQSYQEAPVSQITEVAEPVPIEIQEVSTSSPAEVVEAKPIKAQEATPVPQQQEEASVNPIPEVVSPEIQIEAKPAVSKPKPTEEISSCHPNYTGCVPIASDVDCAGGSGNGPAYVRGPVRVIGSDVYRLDGDKDGIACE